MDGADTLDVQWASGIAPGAEVRVYAPGSIQDADVYKALEAIFADAQKPGGPQHLSLSFGGYEHPSSLGQKQSQSTLFAKLAALGVQTFVSSGDWGSNPVWSGDGFVGCGPTSRVHYPASDPSVISVGGTILQFRAATGTVLSETGWNGSGGGVSENFPRPQWQSPKLLPEQQRRLVPDVASVADDPGAFVVLDGRETAFAGTSWSAPMWAGFSALIAEAREKQGKPPLGFLAPHLYKLPPGAGFRDITTGSNGAYKAGPGWDPVTGLGVPNVKGLIEALP
jgi:kumamolisin